MFRHGLHCSLSLPPLLHSTNVIIQGITLSPSPTLTPTPTPYLWRKSLNVSIWFCIMWMTYFTPLSSDRQQMKHIQWKTIACGVLGLFKFFIFHSSQWGNIFANWRWIHRCWDEGNVQKYCVWSFNYQERKIISEPWKTGWLGEMQVAACCRVWLARHRSYNGRHDRASHCRSVNPLEYTRARPVQYIAVSVLTYHV